MKHCRPFNAVEIGTARLPIVFVAYQLDRFIWFVRDELERSGADWMLPHHVRRYMAGVNRRIPRGKQGNKGGLRSLQVKGCRVAFGADRFQVTVPRLARIGAQLLRSVAQDNVPCAFDIRRGEGLAVVPTDAVPKLKRELCTRDAMPGPIPSAGRGIEYGGGRGALRPVDATMNPGRVPPRAARRRACRVALGSDHLEGLVWPR